jgi:predicted Zn finger-like uncharacterized protein
MDVKCNNCSAEYALDETLVAVTGTSVRCTKCGEVFRVFRDNESTGREDRWLLQQADGATYTFERMGVLQQWIAEGKVSEDDLLAREGEESLWKRIGDIREMQPFFSLVNPPGSPSPTRTLPPALAAPRAAGYPRVEVKSEGKNTLRGQQSPAKETADLLSPFKGPSAQPSGADKPSDNSPASGDNWAPEVMKEESPPSDEEHDLSQIPAAVDDGDWDQGSEMQAKGPAWAERRGALPKYRSEVDSLLPPKKKVGRWVAVGFLVVLITAGVVLFVFQKELDQALGNILSSSDANRYMKFYDLGRESFLLDSETYYRQADREYQKVLALEENHALTLGALAELYAVWAQYLKDAETDEKVDLSMKEEVTEAESRELERLGKAFQEKLHEAQRWATLAVAQNPVPREAHRAMADVKRLEGKLHECREHLDQARSAGTDPETEYLAVLLDLEVGKPAAASEKRLEAIIKEKPLIRAMYRRARILASEEEKDRAQAALKELFSLNSDHLWGRDLAARLDEDKPVLIASGAQAGSSEKEEPPADDKAQEKPAAVEPVVAKTPTKTAPKSDSAASVKKKSGGSTSGAYGNTDAMLMRAKQMQERGKSPSAMGIYKKVLERSPSNVDALSGLAYCYRDVGAKGKAIASFRRALGINASFGPAILGLAETFKSQGQKAQALKHYKNYLKTNPTGRYAGMAKRNATQLEQELGTEKPTVAPAPESEAEEKRPVNEGVTEIPKAAKTPPPEKPSEKQIIIRPI